MITMRAMRAEDTAEAEILEKEIFSQPWSARGFLDAIGQENTIFLVAEEESQLVGYIGMYCALDEGEITNVAVAPQWRRRGIGELLIQELKKEAKMRGILQMILEVRVSNEPAISLYRKNGFENIGIRKGFYELPKEDAYIMSCHQ